MKSDRFSLLNRVPWNYFLETLFMQAGRAISGSPGGRGV